MCPACATIQPAAPGAKPAAADPTSTPPRPPSPGGPLRAPSAPDAPAGFAGPPAGFTGPPAGFVGGASAATAPPPPATPARSSRGRGPLVVVLVVVVALIAGGAFVLTRDDGDTVDASKPASSSSADGSTTAAPATTAKPAPTVTWTPASDPTSGLRWEHPGSDLLQAPDMGALAKGNIGTQARLWVAGELPDGAGSHADVTIWGPGGGVTDASVDELLSFHQDMYGWGKTPYPKALTIAGAPAKAFDASDDDDSRFEAVAFVDGTVVLVELYVPKGESLDPAMFERFVGSFTRG